MFGTAHRASTGCPLSLHGLGRLSTRCGGRLRWSVPTVARVSQTPLYDQLRDERRNADVPDSDRDVSAAEAQQEPLASSGLRPVSAGQPGAVAVRGVSSGPGADLRVDSECFGRHPRPDEVSDLHGGARRVRRLSAQAADGGSRGKATVPTAPAPVHSQRGGTARADPAVDTRAATPAPDAGQRRAWPQPPPAFVRSPVPVPTRQH